MGDTVADHRWKLDSAKFRGLIALFQFLITGGTSRYHWIIVRYIALLIFWMAYWGWGVDLALWTSVFHTFLRIWNAIKCSYDAREEHKTSSFTSVLIYIVRYSSSEGG